MRMNFRKVDLSDYHETIKKKTIINCEEMQYFQDEEEELSEAGDDEDDEDDEDGEERKVGSASTGGGRLEAKKKKNPNSASTQVKTATKGTESVESKGEKAVVTVAEGQG